MSQLTSSSVARDHSALPAAVCPSEASTWHARFADYAELAKLRISVMVLVTVAVGFLVGSQGGMGTDWWLLLNALLGIACIAASSCTVNQYLEISTDLLMVRTRNRPLPSGRVRPREALLFAGITGVFGVVHLWVFVNPLVSLLTLLNWVLYVAIYTPMKRHTSLCTAVGAIPGAMPPVLGWAAAGQPLGWEAFWLFSLMFLWQFPHFLAIAWLYRQDYYQAGLWMLPNGLPERYVTGTLALAYALILLPVSLLPHQYGIAGQAYFWITLGAGLAYVWFSLRFLREETRQTARQLLFCSLIYLPLVLATLTCSHLSAMNSYAAVGRVPLGQVTQP
ncbi:MAG: heme o synthase [Planctomycetaceae bacterium]|nr:heme o synthase [Planctomycetaceae bacterium]